jgi:hypothetical protein
MAVRRGDCTAFDDVRFEEEERGKTREARVGTEALDKGGGMGGKQMEGDSTERRVRAKEARDRGNAPSDEKVTKGASKQRTSIPNSEDRETRSRGADQGKR